MTSFIKSAKLSTMLSLNSNTLRLSMNDLFGVRAMKPTKTT